MKRLIAEKDGILTKVERDRFAISYDKIVQEKRCAWRPIAIAWEDDLIQTRQEIEQELTRICNEVLELLSKFLVHKTVQPIYQDPMDAEAAVFYLKMKGDYYRYLTEIAEPDGLEKHIEEAKAAYDWAMMISTAELKPTNPIHLGLVLNYSQFHFKTREEAKEACDLARDSIAAAEAEVHSLAEHHHQEATVLLQHLADKLKVWELSKELQEAFKDLKIPDVCDSDDDYQDSVAVSEKEGTGIHVDIPGVHVDVAIPGLDVNIGF